MKRVLLILAPVVIIFGLLYGVFKYFENDIQSWVLGRLDVFSQENLPFRIQAKSFELQFISPGLKLSEITVTTKDPALWGFQELKLENARANLDFLQALGGRIFLSSVILEGAQAKVDLDQLITEPASPRKYFNWSLFFAQIQRVPLYRLALIRNKIEVTSTKNSLSIRSSDLDLIVFNQKDKFNFKADLSDTIIHLSPNDKTWDIPLKFRADVTLDSDKFEFHELDLTALNSRIQTHGELINLPELLVDPQGEFEFKTNLSLGEWQQAFHQPDQLISMAGNIMAQGQITRKRGTEPFGKTEITGQAVRISQFDIGDFELKGNYKDKVAHLSDLVLHHPAGDLTVENLQLEIPSGDNISFKGKISTEALDLHDLLEHLNVGDLDLDSFLSGKLECQGKISPSPDVVCNGAIASEQLEVRSGPRADSTIVAVDDLQAQGEVRVTNTAVSYRADLKAFEDQGQSDGVISYQEGFHINYSSPDLHLRNIKNLANLKLEGHGKIQGTTSGNAKSAIMTMNLDLKQASFEDFILGEPKSDISYKEGLLSFDHLQGGIGNSRYSAKVAVDLHKKELQAEGQVPALELSDLFGAIERKLKLPVEVTGFGSAFFKVSGPLQLNQLTYNISAQTFRGQIAGETYDRFSADVSAVKGEVKLDKVLLAKNKAIVSVFGNGHPSGQIDITVRGDRFLLEESENITRLSSSISGIFSWQMGLTGHIQSPDVSLKAALSELSMEELAFPNSAVQLAITKKGLEGSANLLGSRLKCDFLIPFSIEDPFKLKAQALDWNFATLFALIGGANLLPDYQTSISGSLDLASDSGGFFKSTGQGQIDRFILKRGGQSLSTTNPMEFIMKSGVMSFVNFSLNSDQGRDQGFLEVRGSQFTAENLDLKIEGKAPLRLLHIFVPFLEEVAGTGTVSVAVSGKVSKPEILGNANMANGFIKIKSFPHPFERIAADLQFSVSKVLVNQFTGNFAGGVFKGDGSILIEGPRDLPMNIVTHVENANLNVPDGIKTSGDADFSFSGSWFPFLLSGVYRIKSGIIDKEFTEETAVGGLRQSSYLPKIILQSAFEPLIVDIQAQFDKPLTIKNSMMEGSVTGLMQVKGTPSQPTLIGKVQTERNSKLMFKDKIFDITTGNVQFKEGAEINPELYVAARSRVTDYDVSLLVQGTAKAPLIRLSSSPPLSESDIISLLALGVVTAKSDRVGRKEDQNSAMAIASGIVSSTKIGRDLQQAIGFNLQLSSSYDDTKNVSVQKITLSRKLSDKVNLSASRIQGQQKSNEVKLRYLFNNNVSVVGTYEERQALEDAKTSDAPRANESIFGIDLEYKREFK
jgi:translocation and assembly module TamB